MYMYRSGAEDGPDAALARPRDEKANFKKTRRREKNDTRVRTPSGLFFEYLWFEIVRRRKLW